MWWPSTGAVRFDGDKLPVWHEPAGRYIDPETGELLPTWDQALDTIGPNDDPLHVARFGPKFDAQGVLAVTLTIFRQLTGSCTCSPTEADGVGRWPRPDAEPKIRTPTVLERRGLRNGE